ncbi:hypothetical protein PI23P_01125 [Polaribacter irgensii 23-P]|uniref:Uncharacterized protein n=1 Tax=Polaribacter irgensii 23-P TaxID=313594 RepID=A4C2G2_9FLAO|nr:hypothetical protein PI23P_01125 [Polaribacter irgensii 23-P]
MNKKSKKWLIWLKIAVNRLFRTKVKFDKQAFILKTKLLFLFL